MSLSQVFRAINKLNPSTHGRGFTNLIAERVGALPSSGIYTIQSGIKMELDISEYIDRSIYFETFEILCTRLIRCYLRPGNVFVDIGANIGYYSLLAKKLVGSCGRVLAFEPNPRTVQRLRRNIELNGNLDIELFDVALSDRAEEVILYSPSAFHSGETSLRNQDGWDATITARAVAQRLDDIIPPDLKRIDCLKIDVEGAECLVFRGAEKTLRTHKPAILLEVNERAASSFGFHGLDAFKMLLDFCPDYQIHMITPHSIHHTNLHALETQPNLSMNLWLVPKASGTQKRP